MNKHVLHVPGADYRRDHNAAFFADLGFTVHEDRHRDGPMHPAYLAFRTALTEHHEWTLIVQDDAIPFDGWEEELPEAILHSPSPILSLMHFGAVGRKAAEAGFAYGRTGLWGAAVAYHRTAVEGWINLYGRAMAIDPSYPHDDGLAFIWGHLGGGPPAFTARALFDHAPWPSQLGHPSNTRQRRPGFTILDEGPAWDTPGVWNRGARHYLTDRTQEMWAALR